MDRVTKENLLLSLVPVEDLLSKLKRLDLSTATTLGSLPAELSQPAIPMVAVAAAGSLPGAGAGAGGTTVQPPRAPYDKNWYIVRPDEESQSLDALEYNKPVVFFGPELCGKTWLLHSLIDSARNRGAQIVTINLNLFDKTARASLDAFLHKFALRIFKELHLDAAEVERAFAQARGGPVDALNDLMAWTVLGTVRERLVLAIDNVDVIADQPYQDEFFGMLRAWVDGSGFERLHLVLAISTAPALLVKDVHRSPFNLGDVVTLPDFDEQQLQSMARLHGLRCLPGELARLQAQVGGHPYLTRLAFYDVYRRRVSLSALLDRVEADPQGGVFASYLDHLMRRLRSERGLLEALRLICQRTSASVETSVGLRLERAGLVVRDFGRAGAGASINSYRLRYPLYQRMGQL